MGLSIWFTDPLLFVITLSIIGAMVGSFSNVIIYRLPIMLWQREKIKGQRFNLAFPPSACPKCNNRLKFYHNVPVLGWIFLLGKCGFCDLPISSRYPIIEALFATIGGFSAYLLLGLPDNIMMSLIVSLCLWGLIIVAMIAYDTLSEK